MGDQTGCAFKKLQIFIAKGIQLIALGIEHAEDVPVVVAHRHNNLGTSCVERGQITDILTDVTDDDGCARIQRRTAQALGNWEAWIRCRVSTGLGHDHEFVLNDLVNANPAIIARGANHLDELIHSFPRAPSSERKPPDLLQLFTSRVLHSRESNLAQNKLSASGISTFCSKGLIDDDIGKAGIGADRWGIKQVSIIDSVRIAPEDLAAHCRQRS
jgi:hypothetical protein